MQDMADIAELERRIAHALERMGRAVARLAPGGGPARSNGQGEGDPDAAEALEAERAKTALLSAQLALALREPRERDAGPQGQLEAKLIRMTRQLDVQGLELARMRKTAVQLREHLRLLLDNAAEALVDPSQINRAMAAVSSPSTIIEVHEWQTSNLTFMRPRLVNGKYQEWMNGATYDNNHFDGASTTGSSLVVAEALAELDEAFWVFAGIGTADVICSVETVGRRGLQELLDLIRSRDDVRELEAWGHLHVVKESYVVDLEAVPGRR